MFKLIKSTFLLLFQFPEIGEGIFIIFRNAFLNEGLNWADIWLILQRNNFTTKQIL